MAGIGPVHLQVMEESIHEDVRLDDSDLYEEILDLFSDVEGITPLTGDHMDLKDVEEESDLALCMQFERYIPPPFLLFRTAL